MADASQEIAFVLAAPEAPAKSAAPSAARATQELPLQWQTCPADVATKTSKLLSLSGFYVSATTGTAGAENPVFTSVAFSGSAPFNGSTRYTGGKYWPRTDPSYHFYAANVPLTHQSGDASVSADNSTDLVCAYLPVATRGIANPLTFRHVFSRIGLVTVDAEEGLTLSGVSLTVTPCTRGTYHLRTGTWSDIQTGSPVSLAPSGAGSQDNGLLLVPDTYTLTASWTVSNGSRSASFENLSAELSLEAGINYDLRLTLGGGAQLNLLPGVFSVSADQRVRFSPGLLQAVVDDNPVNCCYTATWSFAPHQYSYDTLMNNNLLPGSMTDSFSWVGESAVYDSYGLYRISAVDEHISDYTGDVTGEPLKHDWGENPDLIRDLGSGFFTLSLDQYRYLWFQRSGAQSKLGRGGIINASGSRVDGFYLLPDDWTCPPNCHFTANLLINNGNGEVQSLPNQYNTFDDRCASGEPEAWCDMEAAGAVFFPLIYYTRIGLNMSSLDPCRYWARQNALDAAHVYGLEFSTYKVRVATVLDFRRNGHPVRLVMAQE